MQTQLADFIKDSAQGQAADAILRSCVHCGFCLATCPTYQLLGNELDSPRGRIYLIKQMLEGGPVTQKTVLHLDRCLTCRSCETTCPSGVQYGKLLDIGRAVADTKVRRGLLQTLERAILRAILPHPNLFKPLLRLGQALRPWLPAVLRAKVPARVIDEAWPAARHTRKMLVLDGCVQPALAPQINAAAARVLDRLGISLIVAPQAGCCGAIDFHLDDQAAALDFMRRNIDAWLPYLDASHQSAVEAIVMTASGCGVTVRDYGHYLKQDAAYAEKATRVSAASRDLSEIILAEEAKLVPLLRAARTQQAFPSLAVHTPCTLQHGQKLGGVLEKILSAAGFEMCAAVDRHLCCGAAGTYSILQPALARQLRDNKLAALQANAPEQIVSANIGCVMHLQSGTQTPVKHWINVVDDLLSATKTTFEQR